ncbi:FlgO family outer membrane protein [Alteromonas gracilis]|uniref:FlgO family outer membrane protein n=1 Tax=Alteromonas gracilis TaxID=1479524 RepID=UPI003B43B0D7
MNRMINNASHVFLTGTISRLAKVLSCAALCAGLLAGCSTLEEPKSQVSQTNTDDISALGNVEYHTYMLANELFADVGPARQSLYAVVGFVPVDSMKYSAVHQHPLMLLGHQLEQGMITEATERGFSTQEFKLSNDIIVSDESDRVLTRDIDQLSNIERVDFYITGTMVYQESGAVVNARIINARNKNIVAAATRFFPAELFWREEQVTTRNGKLYRTEGRR